MHNGLSINLLEVGHCTHPGKMVNPALSIKPRAFPAAVAVITHPTEGTILFDTGYHTSFFEATERFPEKCYAIATPCQLHHDEDIVTQLNNLGIASKGVSHIVLSHFHADHIAAVREFSNAQLHCHPHGIKQLRKKPKWQAIRRGYLSELLPEEQLSQCVHHQEFTVNIAQLLRLTRLETETATTVEETTKVASADKASTTESNAELWGKDLFGDGLLYLVHIPGHAAGQLGLLVRLENRWIFLLADACWLIDNLRDGIDQHWLANIICDNRDEYRMTLNALRRLYQQYSDTITFVPSHCQETLDTLKPLHWIR